MGLDGSVSEFAKRRSAPAIHIACRGQRADYAAANSQLPKRPEGRARNGSERSLSDGSEAEAS